MADEEGMVSNWVGQNHMQWRSVCEGALKADVDRGRADECCEGAMHCNKSATDDIPDRHVFGNKRELDDPALSRLQQRFFERAQHLGGLACALGEAQVQLCNLCSRDIRQHAHTQKAPQKKKERKQATAPLT